MVHYSLTCALGFVGGVWACPATVTICPGVVVGPRTLCAPEVRGRLEGGTEAGPGGGEEVPVGGEEVPAFWLESSAWEAELWSLKRDRSFCSRAWMSSLPAVFVWISAPSDSTGCCWAWLWLVGSGGWVAVFCGAWLDEFTGWEHATTLLNGCCSGAGTLPVVLDEPEEIELLPSWDPITAGTEGCVDGGETEEGGTLTAIGYCEGVVSWEDWGGGLQSLPAVWGGTDTGVGETLPGEADEGGEDAAPDFREGNVRVVVEATDSTEVVILLELGTASEWGVTDSCSAAEASNVLPFWIRVCFTSLKACWRVADGAERDRPNDTKGAVKKLKRMNCKKKKTFKSKATNR